MRLALSFSCNGTLVLIIVSGSFGGVDIRAAFWIAAVK